MDVQLEGMLHIIYFKRRFQIRTTEHPWRVLLISLNYPPADFLASFTL